METNESFQYKKIFELASNRKRSDDKFEFEINNRYLNRGFVHKVEIQRILDAQRQKLKYNCG